jgi:hypothetical protein
LTREREGLDPEKVEDLGSPIAWIAVTEGTPVYDPDGNIVGVVERVHAPAEIFEGVMIHTRPLPGRHLYARHDQIDRIHERGVVLSVGRDELTEPEPQPRRRRRRRSLEPGWEARLRRAWDWLTGQR